MLTLSWAPSTSDSVSTGVGAGGGEQAVEHGGRAARDEVAGHGAAAPCVTAGPRDLAGGRVHRRDLGSGEDGRSGRDRCCRKRVRERTHAADGHVPVAGAAPDEVVEEADVLAQVGLAERGEGADEGVGGDDAAERVVRGDRLDELADGARRQRVEEVGVTREGAHVVPRTQRFEDGREDPLGHTGHARVEVGPPGIRVVTAGQRPEGGTGRGGVAVVDEQPAVGVRRHRRVGGEPPPDEPQVEVEVGEDLARQQRHEVGVAREAGIDARRRRGPRRPRRPRGPRARGRARGAPPRAR